MKIQGLPAKDAINRMKTSMRNGIFKFSLNRAQRRSQKKDFKSSILGNFDHANSDSEFFSSDEELDDEQVDLLHSHKESKVSFKMGGKHKISPKNDDKDNVPNKGKFSTF